MKATLVPFLLVFAGCGGGHAHAVHHPSAAEYDAHAAREEAAAKEHHAQYDADESTVIERCATRRGEVSVCWTADYNPTAGHLVDAERHRKAGAKFRALSQVMRETEAKECEGLSAHDRDTSPFEHIEDIVNIESTSRRDGAIFTFRALPSMKVDWLQRVVRCHIARNDAMGHDVPDMPSCPLVPPNVQATVKETPLGFVVEVSSGYKPTVAEIMRRADFLQQLRVRRQEPPR
jgi:hypothetical protein